MIALVARALQHVARAKCLTFWKRNRLDKCADEIIAAVKRGEACEQWQKPRQVPRSFTFRNQERCKDTPPAPEPEKGGLRLRESTPEQVAREKHDAPVRAASIAPPPAACPSVGEQVEVTR